MKPEPALFGSLNTSSRMMMTAIMGAKMTRYSGALILLLPRNLTLFCSHPSLGTGVFSTGVLIELLGLDAVGVRVGNVPDTDECLFRALRRKSMLSIDSSRCC